MRRNTGGSVPTRYAPSAALERSAIRALELLKVRQNL
jgi:hypothetical protein